MCITYNTHKNMFDIWLVMRLFLIYNQKYLDFSIKICKLYISNNVFIGSFVLMF